MESDEGFQTFTKDSTIEQVRQSIAAIIHTIAGQEHLDYVLVGFIATMLAGDAVSVLLSKDHQRNPFYGSQCYDITVVLAAKHRLWFLEERTRCMKYYNVGRYSNMDIKFTIDLS
jgi:hypothetical protein